MTLKTAIVTDSTAYLPAALMEELDIHMIPLAVALNGDMYDEEIDIRQPTFTIKYAGMDRFQRHHSHQSVNSLNCSSR